MRYCGVNFGVSYTLLSKITFPWLCDVCDLRVKSFDAERTENTEFAEKKKRAMKHKCPICKAETDSAFHAEFPFCSERCRERDLGNWASEKYVVSDPIFDEGDRKAVNNEEDIVEGERKTIVLDLDNTNDTEH